MKVNVTISLSYEIPDDESARLEAYGAVGIPEILAVDAANDLMDIVLSAETVEGIQFTCNGHVVNATYDPAE